MKVNLLILSVACSIPILMASSAHADDAIPSGPTTPQPTTDPSQTPDPVQPPATPQPLPSSTAVPVTPQGQPPQVQPTPQAQAAANAQAEEVAEAKAEAKASKTLATESLLYLNAGGGVSYVGLATVNSSKLALGNAAGTGGLVDIGAGVRLVLFTLGPRVRYHMRSSFDMWQINAEIGIHIPVRKWDGYFGLHGGYTVVGTLTSNAFSDVRSPTPSEDLRVRGFDVGIQLGLDYYVNRWFSVGGGISGELLFVRRPALASSKDPEFGVAGGGIGIAAVASLRAGVHF